jgi:tetratricopeptide (TPR) repeat protein
MEEAQEIGTAVSRLPLALHLAGSFLAQYKRLSAQRDLQQLAQQGLWQHPSLQGHGAAHSPTGHELSLKRTFALSLAQLQLDNEVDDAAQQLLLRSACFAPTEPIPQTLLLQTFLADSDDILAELVVEDGLMRLLALGFLALDEKEAVVMHELVASFVQEALAKEMAVGRTAVITTCLRLLDNWLAEKNSLFELPIPSNHLQHITKQALAGEHELAGWLALRWGMHLNQQAEYVRANRFLVAAKERLAEPGAYAHSLHELGTIAYKQARWDEAQAFLMEAWQLRRQLEDKKGEGDTLNHLGQMFSKQGEFETAVNYFQQALDVRRQVGDRYGEAACLNNLGLVANFQGNYAASINYFEQALSLRQRLGNRRWVAQTLNNLGIVFKAQGSYAAAEIHLVQALTIFRQVGDRQMLALVLNNLGDMTIIQARYTEAQAYLTEALSLYRQIGDPLGEVMARMNVGWVAFHLQDVETAVTDLQATLKIARKLGNQQLTGRILGYLTHLFGYQLEVGMAVVYGQEALAIARKIGDRQLEGAALHYLGDATRNVVILHEALAIRQEIGARSEEAQTWHYLGRLALQNKEWETAVYYFRHSLPIHESLNLTHWRANDLAGLLTAFFMLGNKVEMKQYYQEVKTYLKENPSLSGTEHPEQILQFIEAIGSIIENDG